MAGEQEARAAVPGQRLAARVEQGQRRRRACGPRPSSTCAPCWGLLGVEGRRPSERGPRVTLSAPGGRGGALPSATARRGGRGRRLSAGSGQTVRVHGRSGRRRQGGRARAWILIDTDCDAVLGQCAPTMVPGIAPGRLEAGRGLTGRRGRGALHRGADPGYRRPAWRCSRLASQGHGGRDASAAHGRRRPTLRPWCAEPFP